MFFTVRCGNNNRKILVNEDLKAGRFSRLIFLVFPIAAAVRQHILCDIKKRFKTVEEAEDSLGLTLESYLDESNTSAAAKPPATLDISLSLIEKMGHMTPSQLKELIEEAWQLLSKLPTLETDIKEALANSFLQSEWVTMHVTKLITSWFEVSSIGDSILVLNECFQVTAEKMGIETNVLNFQHLSLKSMKTLQDLGKTNTIYNLSKVVGEPRPGGSGTLIPLKRMPFGMVQYIIDFFASTNVMQGRLVPLHVLPTSDNPYAMYMPVFVFIVL